MKKLLLTTWHYIRRTPYQALAAMAIMSLTLFATALFILLAVGSEEVLVYFEKKPQVIAFLKDDTSQEEVDALKLKLLATRKVEEVTYVSQEEALEIYRQQSHNDPDLLEMVSAEILPASLEVSTKEIKLQEEIAQLLQKEIIVEEVGFQEDVVAVLQKIITTIRQVGGGLVIFLILVSFLVVLVIVSMKASSRRREVKIMELLGATLWYIRGPFLLEGVFYGVISAFLAWGASYLLLVYATPFLGDFLVGIPLLPVPLSFMLLLLGGLVLGGVIIGTLGSLIAVKRSLR